ncbi:uncharacterized protein LOC113777839 [Coffea eugenioides]|uniref:uncharacterized protein LOC113777839 n=1 Tax=Coffea eugenioides TaxID=49369 RepID=UPI000F614642|nr:uncharacterized protein LOC113777839 [Coffea eugenioides]XP_027178855.1 uncharacterized protein LOC113777839 [Coffea eugenioides]
MGELRTSQVRDSGLWSEEHDRLPLKQRLKILLARSSFSDLFPDFDSEDDGTSNLPAVDNDAFVKEEDDNGQCGSESFSSASLAREGKVGSWSYEQNHIGDQGGCSDQVIEANKVCVEMVPAEVLSGMESSSCQQSLLSSRDVSINVQCSGHSPSSPFKNPSNCANGGDLLEIKNDNPVDFFDELDHVVLKERQRRLVLSCSQMLGLTKTPLEGNTALSSMPALDDLNKQGAGIDKEETDYVDKESPFGENSNRKMQTTSISGSSKGVIMALPNADHRNSQFLCNWQGNKSIKSGKMTTIQEQVKTCSLEKEFSTSGANGRQNLLSSKSIMHNSGVATQAHAMTCFSENKFSMSGANSRQNLLSSKSSMHNSAVANVVNVKVEPLDNDEASQKSFPSGHLPLDNVDLVKSEPDLSADSNDDELDHLLLRERMKLLSAQVPHSDVVGMEWLSKMVPAGLDCHPIAQESAKPLKINRPRKRRKSATDSVETALEEDAPGLLQVLIQKGVSVNEIKLYGEKESDEALDDLSTEDNFSELEAIISKLFSQRSSLLKLAPLRCAKGDKATYCLACLFSLVEQARYLQFRKWPVEWGWCRDLQAFIFVFERHNRIVLERPEYGYATYFFELMDSLPIDWQIKRLVTAMKLTSCSRVALIENKALVVGEDLTEGEARVLMEYGWIPNSGLGSMLNYCDRVVHDRKSEDTSEWRSKIGKLLIDGYNGGCIVPTDVPKKVVEYNFAQAPQIKMEMN